MNVDDAKQAIRAAYREAADAVSELGDGRDGFDAAGDLAELLRGLAVEAADLRAGIVARLRRYLSYSQLVDLLKISQRRVQQLSMGEKTRAKTKPVTVVPRPVEPPPVVVPEPRPVQPVSAPVPRPTPVVAPVPVAPKVGRKKRGEPIELIPFGQPGWRDAIRAAAVHDGEQE